MLPWLQSEIEEIDAVFGGDAWPTASSRTARPLQALVQYMVEQHFISERSRSRTCFVPIWGASGT